VPLENLLFDDGLMGNSGHGSWWRSTLFELGGDVKAYYDAFNEINNFIDIKIRNRLIGQ
jgi:hypothetical protein